MYCFVGTTENSVSGTLFRCATWNAEKKKTYLQNKKIEKKDRGRRQKKI